MALGMQMMARGWLVLRLSNDSPFALSLVMIAFALPMTCIALIGHQAALARSDGVDGIDTTPGSAHLDQLHDIGERCSLHLNATNGTLQAEVIDDFFILTSMLIVERLAQTGRYGNDTIGTNLLAGQAEPAVLNTSPMLFAPRHLIIDDAISEALEGPGLVYVSIDIDVLDPAMAPGTGTPEPGGLLTRELLRAVRRVVGSVRLAAMDIVEVAPPFDHAEVTTMAAHRVVMEALSALAVRKSSGRPVRATSSRIGIMSLTLAIFFSCTSTRTSSKTASIVRGLVMKCGDR